MKNKQHLLPVGFYDLLGDEAKINQETINILLKTFDEANYQLIKPPLVEFEESLINNTNNWQKIDEQSFKMVDNFSGKTLVLRSDITPQIARLVVTKLQNILPPIKLCYVGDVLKMKNDNLYADRQLTQVGIELIGEKISENFIENLINKHNQDSFKANLEVIELTILALKKIKLSNLIINFCCPQFLYNLFADLKEGEGFISKDKMADLQQAIASKNISAIKLFGGKYSDQLITLVLENANFDIIKNATLSLPISQNSRNQLEELQQTIAYIKQNHQEIEFSMDIFGDEDFPYHHQIGFTVFAGNFSYPIARGGRYLINQSIPAIGSTIYINNLRKILTK